MFQFLQQGSVDQVVFYDQIPFQRPLDLLVIEVEFAGKKRRFLVDSGSPNLIDQRLAEELGLPVELKRKVTDANGRASKLPFVMLDSIKIGKTVYYETGAVVADIQGIPLLSCLGVEGFIGANLMRLGVWQIDYQRQMAHIVNHRDSLDHIPGTLAIPFTTSAQGTPSISCQLASGPEESVILDLGASGGIDLPLTSFYQWSERSQSELIIGYGAISTGLYGLRVDTLRKAQVSSFYLDQDTTNHGPVLVEFSSSHSPSLGNAFFEHYRVTLDWGRMEVFFEPVSPNSVDFRSFGFIPSFQNGQLQVGFLWENSPATQAGLSVGDRILFMNGVDCINMTTSSFCRLINGRYLQDQWSGVELILQKNGASEKVQLRKEVLLK